LALGSRACQGNNFNVYGDYRALGVFGPIYDHIDTVYILQGTINVQRDGIDKNDGPGVRLQGVEHQILDRELQNDSGC
jgi:hypothetical protein